MLHHATRQVRSVQTFSGRLGTRGRAGVLVLAACALLPAGRVTAAERQPDAIVRARALYNAGQYDAAVAEATRALAVPATADAARLVLARSRLERFRQSERAEELGAAREALREIDPSSLSPRDRVELVIGLGEALYLDGSHAAASELFVTALDRAAEVGPGMRERVFDWWASGLDRDAQGRPADARREVYRRVLEAADQELRADPESGAAAYWVAAGARGVGDLARAWNAAMSGWVRARLARDLGAPLRADLDRLVIEAIIPERARELSTSEGDRERTASDLRAEWDLLKEQWR
jgi:tetratricopeptide (TPR) repeat protein